MTTVALHIIAKDNVEDLKRLIQDYSEYVDEIDIAVDVPEVMNEFGHLPNVNIYEYKWSEKEVKRGFPNFDDKRNFLVDKCNCDFYLRLDTDDEIVDPTVLRAVLERADKNKIDIVSCYYDYSRDPYGNTCAAHNRETLIRNNGKYHWNKHIHENVVPKIHNAKMPIIIDKSLSIYHRIDETHANTSGSRNLKFLMEEYEETKDDPDPRTLAYLGRMLYPLGHLKEARYFLEKHIEMSGWDEDKYLSWCYLAELMHTAGDFDQALACCHEAMNERPDLPDAYLKLLDFYHDKQDWAKAIHWGKIGLALERPVSFMLTDPSSYTWRPAIAMAYCHLMIGEAEKALKFFNVAEKAAPQMEWIQKNKGLFQEAVNHKAYIEKFAWMLQFLKDNDSEKIVKMFDIIPKELQKHELLVQMRHRHVKPREHDDNEVTIYCGKSWEDWAAPSVLKGIGGSEEAVIYLSKELTKLGKKVTVYNSCGDLSGTYEGVTYKEFFEFNPYDKYNTLIAWRGNIFGQIEAKKKLIWLHDVPIEMFKEDERGTFDKAIVLSEYHKSLLPDTVSDEQTYVSTNGINVKDFKLKEYPERNPYRMIYTSSYDRGIENLLDMWPDIKKAVPQAELHLFYGWETYDAIAAKGLRDPAEKKRIVQKINQPGITDHGRVNHKKLIKEFYKSGLYVYPCHFQEISCISAMKAQACGCLPVTTDFAALVETVKDGVIVEGQAGKGDTNERYKKALIDTLKGNNGKYQVKHDFSWAAVAKQWVEDIL